MSLDSWLHVAAAVLLTALLAHWARRRPGTLFALAAMVVAAVAAYTLVSDAWLVRRLTILHEGNSARTLEALFKPSHVGAGASNLFFDLSEGHALPITALVRLNLAATVLWASGLTLAVIEELRPKWWVVPIVAVLVAMSPLVHMPALSELPSPLLNLYFVAGLLPAAVLARGEDRRVVRYASAILLGMLGVLMVRARVEMAILVLPAAAVLLLQLRRTGPFRKRVDAAERYMLDRCAWLLGHPARLVGAVVLCLGAQVAVEVAMGGHASWVAAALNPLDLLVFRLPVVIGEATSLGVAALCCLGWFYALKRWRSYAGLALALIVMGRLYLSSSHRVDAETFRYLTHVGAALLFLATLGVRQLFDLYASRSEGGAPPRTALAAVALLCIPVGGNVLGQARQLTPYADAEQREARFVASQIRQRPECFFIAPVTHDSGSRSFLVLHAGHRPSATASIEDALAVVSDTAGRPACTLLYTGLDCHLVGALDCSGEAGEADAAEVVASEHFVAQRYSHSPEYGFMNSDITLRVRELH